MEVDGHGGQRSSLVSEKVANRPDRGRRVSGLGFDDSDQGPLFVKPGVKPFRPINLPSSCFLS